MTLNNPLDEGTDTTNVAHLRTFIRNVFTNFDILEQFLELVKMQSTAIGKDILKANMQCPNISF